LLAFLEAGSKPIVVSLGVMSMSGKRAHQSAEIVLAAIRQAGVRAIVQGWNNLLPELNIPESVYPAGSMPHGWLFDQASAIVHHGGFGTTAAALQAGVPSILIPHVIDQFYWGQRVFELGVSPQFVSRGKLTAENLTAAITLAMEDDDMRSHAAEQGNAIRAEPDGVTAAVKEISRIGG
jgi:UDP:flavonoid glycosyltransferase YjiC (YdhE family)